MLERISGWQVHKPLLVVVIGALLGAAALPLVLQLGLRGDIAALLPNSKASVADMEAIQGRYGKSSTLSIAVSGDRIEPVRAFARALAKDLQAEPLSLVADVDWNIGDYIEFAEKNRYLYAPLQDLKDVRSALEEKVEWEKAKANPLFVVLDDQPPGDLDEALEKVKQRQKEADADRGRFPDGFYQHPDKPLVLMFLRTKVKVGDTTAAEQLVNELGERIARVREAHPELASVKTDLGADLMDMLLEVQAIAREMVVATVVTIILVLIAIWLFFMSKRAIPALGGALVVPVLISFAIAELTVDALNSSTAFLGSIIIGNGVNPNVIWLSRYYELRRSGTEVAQSIKLTHQSTWQATLTASAAAGLAYASLMITDFRGFRDFGIIGGAGMLVCWLGAYLLLPALMVLAERIRPIAPREGAHRNVYGVAFGWLALRAPRVIVVSAVLVSLVSVFVVHDYLVGDPMEYDFRNLQSERDPDSRVQWVNDQQSETVNESQTGSGIVVSLDDIEDVPAVKQQLARISEEQPEVLGAVRTIEDLVPPEQDAKVEVLAELRELLVEMREYAKGEDLKTIDKYMPPEDLKAFKPQDVPASALLMWTELSGKVGRMVYVEHPESQHSWDGAYMIRWARAVRQVRQSDGSRPPATGNAAVFADIMSSIYADGPKAVGAALSVTCLLVLLAFRRLRDRFLTLASLLVGILWMTAWIAAIKLKLNFLNFVAFPITFGNGADYGVNLMSRFVQEDRNGEGDRRDVVRRAVEGTGGAVVLCSLTTIFGYISLYASSNKAINSFGVAMAISEVTCVLAAIATVPALLALGGKKRPSEPKK